MRSNSPGSLIGDIIESPEHEKVRREREKEKLLFISTLFILE